jgi:hypothetical protein
MERHESSTTLMCPLCGGYIYVHTIVCNQGNIMMPDGCPFNQIGFRDAKRKYFERKAV